MLSSDMDYVFNAPGKRGSMNMSTENINHNAYEQSSNALHGHAASTKETQVSHDYRGRCKYKSGRCPNERTFKYNGDIHTLCEYHRIRHNNNQRRSDSKRRRNKKGAKSNQPLDVMSDNGIESTSNPHDIQQDIWSNVYYTRNEEEEESYAIYSATENTQIEEDTSNDWNEEDIYIFQELMQNSPRND